jgi:7-cyano-7-deazaguanine reductase
MVEQREGNSGRELLLGKHIPVVDEYTPALLYPITRTEGRARLGLGDAIPFYGVDLWHAYEMSWLEPSGKPVVRVGRFSIPASSPCMVESKSFKLYLNSLNNTQFASEADLHSTVVNDISSVVGARVALELLAPADPSLSGTILQGLCLDDLPLTAAAAAPAPAILQVQPGEAVQQRLYSHLLRSLCPVTGQPDWATVWLHYSGAALDHASLLRYIISYRQHQEFHEQCVERMFLDIHRCCTPQFLHIQAFYTRRGGLDINPFRSTDPAAQPLPRLSRQ